MFQWHVIYLYSKLLLYKTQSWDIYINDPRQPNHKVRLFYQILAFGFEYYIYTVIHSHKYTWTGLLETLS